MSKKKKTGLVIAIVAVIVIALGVLGFFIFKGLGAANAVANDASIDEAITIEAIFLNAFIINYLHLSQFKYC